MRTIDLTQLHINHKQLSSIQVSFNNVRLNKKSVELFHLLTTLRINDESMYAIFKMPG